MEQIVASAQSEIGGAGRSRGNEDAWTRSPLNPIPRR